MRIKLIAPVIGALTGKAGDEFDTDEKFALNLIRAGYAVKVQAPEFKLETATLKETLETAVTK
jgi:hypothetical protein